MTGPKHLPGGFARLSRRAFVEGAALSVLCAPWALCAVRSESSLTSVPPLDLLVVGSGIAGLSAACAAREAGAQRVIVIEKGPLLGGHSIYSSGSIAVTTGRTTRPGFADSVERFVADAQTIGEGRGDERLLRAIAAGSEEALLWLEALGIYFGAPFTAHSGLSPRCFSMPGNSAGRSYILALVARARALGIDIRLHAPALSLRRSDAEGLWVVAAGGSGKHASSSYELRARSVVIATGGFTADVERRRAVNPLLTADVMTTANPYGTVWDGATGDGIDLVLQAGGALRTGYGLQMLPFWGGRLTDYVGADIYLTASGRRFVNEALSWNRVSEAILRLPERECWVVTDRQSYKGATLGLKLINGIVHKAETVEALASGMGVEEEVLARTLYDYNRAVDAGRDPLTGKTVFAQRIDRPPFYYGKERIYAHTTLDGVRTDERARVTDEAGRPVEGLFAAGEVVGGIFGTDRLGGAQLTNCLVMGRTAGKEAARRVRGETQSPDSGRSTAATQA